MRPSLLLHFPAQRPFHVAYIRTRSVAAVVLAAASACLAPPAQAQLFGDNEARRAIIDLRQRYQALNDEVGKLRSSLLEQQAQIETLRGDLAKSRGREEQLARDVGELQRRQKELARTTESRAVNADEQDATAGASTASGAGKDKAEFDAALNQFRNGDYSGAQVALRNFLKNRPQSAHRASAQFWLGNSDYALRNYRSAIGNFRAVVSQAPSHERAPEALLSIANCQVELRETAAARTTLEQLVAKYPRSEAAQAAKDRLARMK